MFSINIKKISFKTNSATDTLNKRELSQRKLTGNRIFDTIKTIKSYILSYFIKINKETWKNGH